VPDWLVIKGNGIASDRRRSMDLVGGPFNVLPFVYFKALLSSRAATCFVALGVRTLLPRNWRFTQ
jgi:hypothetical protein